MIALCMLAGFATAGAESQHFEGKPWMNSNFFGQYLPSREDVEPGSADSTHPYCSLRINFAVQHFDEFYRTYPSVTEGTPMYLAPEERLLVW